MDGRGSSLERLKRSVDAVPHRRKVLAGSVLFFAAYVGAVAIWGLPSRNQLMLWIVVGLLVSSIATPAAWRRIVIDWIPLAVFLAGYDLVRGMSYGNQNRAHVDPQLAFDKVIGLGTIPTVHLQHWMFRAQGFPHWWDWTLFSVYMSHFWVYLVAGALIWRFDYGNWRRFASMFLALSVLALVTFAAYPTAAPWLASREGKAPATARVVKQVFGHAHLHSAGELWGLHTRIGNPVAAVPSLHAAWPFLLMLFLWRGAGRWRFALLGWNLLMALSIVYGAEHYAFDVFAGWAYAAVAFFGVDALRRHRQEARARTAVIDAIDVDGVDDTLLRVPSSLA